DMTQTVPMGRALQEKGVEAVVPAVPIRLKQRMFQLVPSIQRRVEGCQRQTEVVDVSRLHEPGGPSHPLGGQQVYGAELVARPKHPPGVMQAQTFNLWQLIETWRRR